jgi:hypothetical protein
MATDNSSFESCQARIRDHVATICLKYMNSQRLTKAQFAGLIQLSTSQLKQITNRRCNTTLNVLAKISRVTGERIII